MEKEFVVTVGGTSSHIKRKNAEHGPYSTFFEALTRFEEIVEELSIPENLVTASDMEAYTSPIGQDYVVQINPFYNQKTIN